MKKLFWIIGQDSPLQFAMVAELEGKVTIEEYRKALMRYKLGISYSQCRLMTMLMAFPDFNY